MNQKKLFSLLLQKIIIICSILTLLISDVIANRQHETADKLYTLEAEIKERTQTRNTLQKETRHLVQQRKNIKEKMTQLVIQIRKNETQINNLEKNLNTLQKEEKSIHTTLNKDRMQLAQLLAILQRTDPQFPPRMIVQPHDSLANIRATLTISQTIPSLKQKADTLQEQLNHLKIVRNTIKNNQTNLNTITSDTQTKIETLLQHALEKEKMEKQKQKSLQQERITIKNLGHKAKSLRELLTRLKQQSKIPSNFAKMKGKLPLPVSGKLLNKTQTKQLNRQTGREGVYIECTQNTIITAPHDGTIVYVGSFLDYGNMIILNMGKNYHLLLAGLDTIHVNVEQFVTKDTLLGQIYISPLSYEQQTLYMEIRYQGESQDPFKWFIKQ